MSSIPFIDESNYSIQFFLLKICQVVPSLILNALMISYFVKSLALLGAGRATALNSGLNFLFASFNEAIFLANPNQSTENGISIGIKKVVGIALVSIGIYLISDDEIVKEKKKEK